MTELLHELDLPYLITDVYSFGYLPDGDSPAAGIPGIFVDVFTRDENGTKTGTERIVRWITYDVKYKDWGSPPSDYPVLG